MKTVKISVLVILFSVVGNVFGQTVSSIDELDQQYMDWYNLDQKTHGFVGVATEKAYDELIGEKKTKKTVVVAVMDSGVDIDHDDLKGRIWINEKEIDGNGIDDDANGFIDDIHGWNYLGNSKGENLHYENMEFTRLYRTLKPIYENVESEEGLSNQEKADYHLYLRVKEHYNQEAQKRTEEMEGITRFEMIFQAAKGIIKNEAGTDDYSIESLKSITASSERIDAAKAFLIERFEEGFTEEVLRDYKRHTEDYVEKYLNIDFNPRKIIGDDPMDITDTAYGNPDVIGPGSNHGTAVSGVIAAVRNNGLGINGIAEDVKIMVLRTTPDGDERDKDVALAIRYAVDNGADIINMSFGKDFSPQKHFVDEAVKYAEAHNVLIIHAAGNDAQNVEEVPSYPSDAYLDGIPATNWLNVGASAPKLDKELVASFSNYAQHQVDIFAPGQHIISLDTANTYSMNDGTSLAAPVVAGVAALVLSYYPDLTCTELIDVLMESSSKIKKPKVYQPNPDGEKGKPVKFATLSKSGGIVNAYEAMLLAEKKYGNR
ncbi:MAG: S8 family serine peptidase [Cyclobacteriaceae bacterium]|nr:S8 family serine peptidase [Cyclobacteriaceae bacterium]